MTPSELANLAGYIKALNDGFVITHFGRDPVAITDDEYNQLAASGMISKEEIDLFRHSYQSGYLVGWQQENNQYSGLNSIGAYKKGWKSALKQGMPPLSPVEEAAIFHHKAKAAQELKGLGNKYADNLTTLAIETEHETRKQLEAGITDQISEGILNRETARKVASGIGDVTEDWARDVRRIAATELEDAYQHGWAQYYKKTSGPETRIARLVDPDGCKDCRRLYYDGGRPKIFSLSELEGNGTNVGLKRSQWQPVVGATHPWCNCRSIRVPGGFALDESGRMVPESSLDG
jgi:hypothetical protein